MKAIFPLLLCYVLMTAQTFALSGGPVFRSVNSYIGYYGGTLRATTGLLTTETDVTPSALPVNAVGIYSVFIDANASSVSFSMDNTTTTGATSTSTQLFTSGTFAFFLNGNVYQGVIAANVNPTNGNLTGLLNAQANILAADGTSGVSQANGYVNAKLRTQSSNSQSNALRMTGKANLTINYGPVNVFTLQPIAPTLSLTLNVSGYQQTTVTTVSNSGGSSTGTAGSSSVTTSSGG